MSLDDQLSLTTDLRAIVDELLSIVDGLDLKKRTHDWVIEYDSIPLIIITGSVENTLKVANVYYSCATPAPVLIAKFASLFTLYLLGKPDWTIVHDSVFETLPDGTFLLGTEAVEYITNNRFGDFKYPDFYKKRSVN